MKVKTNLLIFLTVLLLFACASVPIQGKMFHGEIQNNTGLVVDLAIVDVATGKLHMKHMFGVYEVWEVSLPAGHWHIIASCSKGYIRACLRFPETLQYPDKPWHIGLWLDEPGREA